MPFLSLTTPTPVPSMIIDESNGYKDTSGGARRLKASRGITLIAFRSSLTDKEI